MLNVIMRIIFFILSSILFSFETTSKETVYTCLEWNLELTEYLQDFLYTEKRGSPYFAIEEENTLIIFDERDIMQLLKLIGNYDKTTKIYSSQSLEDETYDMFFFIFNNIEDSSDEVSKFEIKKFSYNTKFTYISRCF